MPKLHWRARNGVNAMRAVIDTNVLVSALINQKGSPGQVIDKIRALVLTPVLSPAILQEYSEVLRRARFGFATAQVETLLADMQGLAQPVRPAPIALAGLSDPDDAPFIAAALWAACPIVTGNARHFPADAGVEILSPAACIERLLKG